MILQVLGSKLDDGDRAKCRGRFAKAAGVRMESEYGMMEYNEHGCGRTVL